MPRSLCAAQRGGRHCPNGIIIAAHGGLVNAEHAAHPLCQGALCGAFRPAKAGRNAAGRGRRGAAWPGRVTHGAAWPGAAGFLAPQGRRPAKKQARPHGMPAQAAVAVMPCAMAKSVSSPALSSNEKKSSRTT